MDKKNLIIKLFKSLRGEKDQKLNSLTFEGKLIFINEQSIGIGGKSSVINIKNSFLLFLFDVFLLPIYYTFFDKFTLLKNIS